MRNAFSYESSSPKGRSVSIKANKQQYAADPANLAKLGGRPSRENTVQWPTGMTMPLGYNYLKGIQMIGGNQFVQRLAQMHSSASRKYGAQEKSTADIFTLHLSHADIMRRANADRNAGSMVPEEDNEAFTMAENLFIGKSKKNPASSWGKRSLMHELGQMRPQRSMVEYPASHNEIIQCKTRNLAQTEDLQHAYRMVQTRSGARIVDLQVGYNGIFDVNNIDPISLANHLECLCELRMRLRGICGWRYFGKIYVLIKMVIHSSCTNPWPLVENDIESELRAVILQFYNLAGNHFHDAIDLGRTLPQRIDDYKRGKRYYDKCMDVFNLYKINDPLIDTIVNSEREIRWILGPQLPDQGALPLNIFINIFN